MSTQAQIDANRENAKKSTGPKTAEGKAAVSQNAVKHGFFAHEAVVHGESQADFDLHRQAFLDELRPAGMTESMLAERIVSLSWRLHRAERMESQAIDDLIIRAADSSEITRSLLEPETRQALADAGTLNRDLSLGQAVTKDFASYRILDRLMLYERRMENSMVKMIRELKKLQAERETEQAAASCRGRLGRASRGHLAHDWGQPSQTDPRDRASRGHLAHDWGQPSQTDPRDAEHQSAQESPSARRQRSNLKKQSQSSPALMGTKSCARKDYDDEPPAEASKNKANQTQTETQGRPSRPVKGEIAAALRALQ
jgi:hypothetical protein